MTTLLCFGFGYCAEHFVAAFGEKFERIIGTVRGRERAAVLKAYGGTRFDAVVFDGEQASSELRESIAAANYVLVSAPPAGHGDPVLAACAGELAEAKHLRAAVYLSTIGVYGDRDGGWVDESAAAEPISPRARDRVAAEQTWLDFGQRRNIAVAVLRLAGIYGPGQNALVQLASGKARRIAKPGQIFNRIHVADIAQAIDAAFARKASGIFNVADDQPSPPADPIIFAAQLMGVAPPAEVPFAEAASTMSPMARSFWQECRRVRNDRLKRELGVVLRYPTYREGLTALFSANSGP